MYCDYIGHNKSDIGVIEHVWHILNPKNLNVGSYIRILTLNTNMPFYGMPANL